MDSPFTRPDLRLYMMDRFDSGRQTAMGQVVMFDAAPVDGTITFLQTPGSKYSLSLWILIPMYLSLTASRLQSNTGSDWTLTEQASPSTAKKSNSAVAPVRSISIWLTRITQMDSFKSTLLVQPSTQNWFAVCGKVSVVLVWGDLKVQQTVNACRMAVAG